MANEKRPSNQQQPDDEPIDEWDDLLDDDEVFDEPAEAPEPVEEPKKPISRPARSRKQIDKEDPAPRKRVRKEEEREPTPKQKLTPEQKPEPKRRKPETKKKVAAEKAAEEFRPEDLEGAEKTKDGLIRVKEGAPKKKADDENGKVKEPWLKSLGVVDYIGLAASLAILAGLAGMLLTWMYGQEFGSDLDRPEPVPELPAVGELFKITSIESYWRRRVDTDRAPGSEIIIPEVTIEVEAVGSEGFLSVFFLDPTKTMSADPGNLILSGGQIAVRENEGVQEGPNRFTFTSTKGFSFEPEFRSYISLEEMKPWAIEIVETREYGSDNDKRLAFFEIARDARTKEDPAAAVATAE